MERGEVVVKLFCNANYLKNDDYKLLNLANGCVVTVIISLSRMQIMSSYYAMIMVNLENACIETYLICQAELGL